MRCQKHLKSIINEILLIKSMKGIFLTVLLITDVFFPIIFILLSKVKPDSFYGNTIEMIQYCYPFFSSLLVVFVLRNYIEHYNCEVYFINSKIKIKEVALILLIYTFELLIPFLVCFNIDKKMVFEFGRVFAQCLLFSSCAYTLMFITMSVPISISVLFIYLIVSLYNMQAHHKILVFCSYEEMSKENILNNILPLVIASLIFILIGMVANYYRSKNYSSNI